MFYLRHYRHSINCYYNIRSNLSTKFRRNYSLGVDVIIIIDYIKSAKFSSTDKVCNLLTSFADDKLNQQTLNYSL